MKKKNEGFTLVELVIAVVILAIAVSPLVANFISSSRMNLKARKSLNAMNLAQDIMEGMSQYTVSQNLVYFDKSVSNNALLENVGILPKKTTNGAIVLDAAKSSADKKVYSIDEVKTIAGGYNTYDMVLTLDATKVNGNDVSAKKINSRAYSDLTSIDLYYDCEHDISYQDEADLNFSKIVKNYDSSNLTPYKGVIRRDIHVTITNIPVTDAEGNTKDHFYVEMYKQFRLLHGTTEQEAKANNIKKDGNSLDTSVVTSPVDLITGDAENMPRNIYIFYEGMKGSQNSVDDKSVCDYFYFENKTGNPVTFYLIRTLTEAEKLTESAANDDYGSIVVLDSYTLDGVGNKVYDNNIDLVYNLRANLSYDENDRIYQEGPGNVVLPGKSVGDTSYYDRNRCKIYYNSSTDLVTEDVYKEHIFDEFKTYKKNLLYDVTIELYEHGKTDKIATYTGGLSN